MSGPIYRAKRAAEDAIALLLTKKGKGSFAGVTFYKGFAFDGDPIKTPRIEVKCRECEPLYIGGTFVCWEALLTIDTVEVYSQATRTTFAGWCGAIEHIILDPDIKKTVNTLRGLETPIHLQADHFGWQVGKSIDGVREEDYICQQELIIRFLCYRPGKGQQA